MAASRCRDVDPASTPRRCRPSRVRLKCVLPPLLLVLILAPLVAHHYMSRVEDGEGDGGGGDEFVRRARVKLDAWDDASSGATASDLRMRVDELLRIKSSVGNELRELESRRQSLQVDISKQQTRVDELKLSVVKQEADLQRLQLSIEEARRVREEEAAEHLSPEIAAPLRILPPLSDPDAAVAPPHAPRRCRAHTCFDVSRCPISARFSVYVYAPEEVGGAAGRVEAAVRGAAARAFATDSQTTRDAAAACLYVVVAGGNPSELARLPHWHGDGRNHLLLRLTGRVGVEEADAFAGVDTGRAMVASAAFLEGSFRRGFDIVLPVMWGASHGQVWEGLPPQVPARRTYLLSFQGEYRPSTRPREKGGAAGRKLKQLEQGAVMSASKQSSSSSSEEEEEEGEEAEAKEAEEEDALESYVVETLKKMQVAAPDDGISLEFSCPPPGGAGVRGARGEWSLCGDRQRRAAQLRNSTFALIVAPARRAAAATALTAARLQEALRAGAVPVVLGGDAIELPFGELIAWRRAALLLPRARVTELHFVVRSVADADLLAMRRRGRALWERHLATTEAAIRTAIAAVRSRLLVPPPPRADEASPSAFNATYRPQTAEVVGGGEPEESVGSVEPRHASPRYRRNYTWSAHADVWNDDAWSDPFHLYPHTPFDPTLPTEAKFLGSGLGFRPIGNGAGGAGKEFSEALGGNVPREQFTVVLLTYEREAVLISSLQKFYALPHLNKVIVVWNSEKPPPEDLRWPEIGVPIHVIKTNRNSLNNRFLPYDVIETEAILSMDDDTHLRHDEIMFAFRVWREARERIVGFPGRFHAWDVQHKNWLYNSNHSCELSMVLTGAAFFHKYYSYMYSYVMPQAIRDRVDAYMNCEDIALNFLVSHITRKPPIKVTSRWTFNCPGCPVALWIEDSHFEERHKCINFFVEVYGYNPLLYTQFRADSVLFKTRIPHDKQKCFKYI